VTEPVNYSGYFEAVYNSSEHPGEVYLWGYARTRFPASITFYPSRVKEDGDEYQLNLAYIQPIEGDSPNE
jgi:hypothetical protein